MNRKFNDRYTTCINLERSIYSKIDQLLPRGVCISDIINEFLKQRLLALEQEQNETGVNNGPLSKYESLGRKNSNILEQASETRLDIYSPKQDLVNHVQKIPDSKTAWTLKRNAKLLVELAETKAKELAKGSK